MTSKNEKSIKFERRNRFFYGIFALFGLCLNEATPFGFIQNQIAHLRGNYLFLLFGIGSNTDFDGLFVIDFNFGKAFGFYIAIFPSEGDGEGAVLSLVDFVSAGLLLQLIREYRGERGIALRNVVAYEFVAGAKHGIGVLAGEHLATGSEREYHAKHESECEGEGKNLFHFGSPLIEFYGGSVWLYYCISEEKCQWENRRFHTIS